MKDIHLYNPGAGSPDVKKFRFFGHDIRALLIDGKPCFVRGDILAAAGQQEMLEVS